MKTITGIIAVFLLAVSTSYSQKSIDDLFEKYQGKDGFVTVEINGNLLNLLKSQYEDDEENSLPKNITSIRILAEDDENWGNVETFHNLVIRDIDISKYEEFMRIKESGQDVRMLVKMEGNKFTEFLLIAGGRDNALIQIKGSMTINEARKFADDAKKEHGTNFIKNSQE